MPVATSLDKAASEVRFSGGLVCLDGSVEGDETFFAVSYKKAAITTVPILS